MIQGQTNTETLYRSVQLDSSSSLKDFSMDRKKYYRKYVLGEKINEKENLAVTIGKVVETLLLEPHEFDNKFVMSNCTNAPTGLMLEFVEALYIATKEATDDFGVVRRTFEDISKEAYVLSGFKIAYEAVMKKFIGSEAELYYDEIRKIRASNLTVVTAQDINNSEKIVQELRNNRVTSFILSIASDVRYTVHSQFQIENYVVDNHHFKSMMDRVIIDHQEKTIQVYDLKCTWTVENFYSEYYLYRRAYIQGYLYYRGCFKMTNDKKHELYGYTVVPPKFIVCDSTNYYNPLIYVMTDNDLQEAYEGFTHNGRFYAGVKELIVDLNWALFNGIWNISRKNYESDGFVNLKN